MLTRIYGTAFHSQADLDEHVERLEAARENDHRRLGPELGLFRFREESPGMPFWLPNGTVLLRLIEAEVQRAAAQARLRRDQDARGARRGALAPFRPLGQLPREHVLRRALAGEGDHERRFALKPMNCPGACLVFGSERHSYRDLPLRMAEFGHVYRYEREGVLHGLLRVRSFTQDDAHVYCTLDQIVAEVDSMCEMIDELYARFGFEPARVELSTRPEKSIGDDEQWERAEAALAEALEGQGREYDLNPGDGAFYGPKIDFHVTDALGRSWQLGTVQVDFQMPERFELSYQGEDNADHRPVMIHRACVGSMERFAGILIEHYGGRFPAWLAPVQAIVLPVSDPHNDYGRGVADELTAAGVRVRVDDRSESVGRKIRDAELAKVPFMLVVGEREEADGTASVRAHDRGDLGPVATGGIAAVIDSAD